MADGALTENITGLVSALGGLTGLAAFARAWFDGRKPRCDCAEVTNDHDRRIAAIEERYHRAQLIAELKRDIEAGRHSGE